MPLSLSTTAVLSGCIARASPGFSPLHEQRFAHEHRGAPETVIVDRVLSISFIAALPDTEREAVMARLRTLIATDPEISGKTEIAVPYTTFAFTAQKL